MVYGGNATQKGNTMTLEQAMEKASKLLRLANSSNANEAAAAASMAQKILARFNIDQAALSLDGAVDAPVESIGKDHAPLDNGGRKLATWKAQMAMHVAQANACRVYQSGAAIMLVGRASDVAKVRALYAMLTSEVDRLTMRLAMGRGRTYANSFRHGAVVAIGEKLRAAQAAVAAEMRAEQSGNAHALARIDNALVSLRDRDASVETWMDENMNLRSSRRSVNVNGQGRAAGYAAGQTVNVSGNAAIAGGRRQLTA